MSEVTSTSILTNMNAWINPDEHYSPDLHTVKEILALHKLAGEDSARNAMNGLFSMGSGNDMMQEMEGKMKIAKETRQTQGISTEDSITKLKPLKSDISRCHVLQ